MTRITCRQPSTGKPINIRLESVGINWTTIAEAPDFSVPDPSGATYVNRDTDPSRGIAAGEVFFLTPLVAKNKTGSNATISVRFLPENTVATNDAIGDILVPAGQSVAIPIQGRSLVKRFANSTNGDRLQVKSSVSGAFDVWASVNEQASAEHVGVTP
jgi:hypothetical protein